MPTFQYTYEAVNQMGEEVSGKLEAESMENANSILVSRQLIPINISEQDAYGSGWLRLWEKARSNRPTWFYSPNNSTLCWLREFRY